MARTFDTPAARLPTITSVWSASSPLASRVCAPELRIGAAASAETVDPSAFIKPPCINAARAAFLRDRRARPKWTTRRPRRQGARSAWRRCHFLAAGEHRASASGASVTVFGSSPAFCSRAKVLLKIGLAHHRGHHQRVVAFASDASERDGAIVNRKRQMLFQSERDHLMQAARVLKRQFRAGV